LDVILNKKKNRPSVTKNVDLKKKTEVKKTDKKKNDDSSESSSDGKGAINQPKYKEIQSDFGSSDNSSFKLTKKPKNNGKYDYMDNSSSRDDGKKAKNKG
jgi:hypothetical protein